MEEVDRVALDAGWKVEQEAVEFWSTTASDIAGWAVDFNERVSALKDRSNILVGYSMGGRMSMQAIVDSGDLWSAAILISADPGTSDSRVRNDQLARDRLWARKLALSSVGEVIQEWDELEVFGGVANSAPRVVGDLKSEEVARVMVAFSKGNQQPLFDALIYANIPIHYVSGANDARYKAIGERLSEMSPLIYHSSIDGAGHRVPWEARALFTEELIRILRGYL